MDLSMYCPCRQRNMHLIQHSTNSLFYLQLQKAKTLQLFLSQIGRHLQCCALIALKEMNQYLLIIPIKTTEKINLQHILNTDHRSYLKSSRSISRVSLFHFVCEEAYSNAFFLSFLTLLSSVSSISDRIIQGTGCMSKDRNTILLS